ncbi:MAG: hypothetical protein OHK93_004143 [Ramalina farinacea]|uniref:Ketoreductase domain-containing protein n=1 Tax=Ramalina farinacea TaxID=258253 RepID=A0AA43TSF2_9LECA|nr:hypothetical protein [Ramalina farinacea]
MPPSPTDPRPNPLAGPGDYTTTTHVHSDTYPAISPLTADLSGKSIFIAGASKGIGKAIALSYARGGASRIALAARSDLSSLIAELRTAAAEAQRPEPPEILPVQIDITDRASVEAGAKLVADKFGGKLDIVVHNSGVLNFGNVVEGDPEQWWRNWEVNVKGLQLVARSFVPLLLAGQEKTFVAISSVGAHLLSPGLSGYQTSKLAVLRLMEFLDAEYADKGLLAYAVHPGNVPGTDILGEGGEIREELRFVFTETGGVCGDTLVFLTRERRGWLAGRYVNCTWDMPELMMKEEEIVGGDKLKVRLVL